MVPRSISNLFQRTDDIHNYETRQVQIIFHLNQTLISRKSHLVTGVRWLGIVYLVILKNLKPSNVLKISFNCNKSNFYIYGIFEDHSFCNFCFISVYI